MQGRVFRFAFILVAFCAAELFAQSPTPRPYDGIQAGLDAFKLAEERRQANIVQQMAINEQMRAWSGYGYGYGYATPLWQLTDLDYAYAYGGRRYWNQTRERYWTGPLTVFEPWPVVPGDIYGYTYFPLVRQPIGQQQTQTGPNRWESHPVYDPPLVEFRPLPPVESPLLDRTPYAVSRRGPREY